MPIPKNIPQDRIIINGQKATDLGREPVIIKPWKDPKNAGLIDPITMMPREDALDDIEKNNE